MPEFQFQPDRNCWRVERASCFSFIVDGQAYFRALRESLLKAQRLIIMVGWDFDFEIEMLPGESDDQGMAPDGLPNQVGPFIDALADRRPDLDIYLLKWSGGALIAPGRVLPAARIKLLSPDQVHLAFDGRHPIGACHHQKIAVIDDSLAFCGGIDMTDGRWDRPEHAPEDDLRRLKNGDVAQPWHDASAVVSGPAAAALSELARDRWARANDAEMDEAFRPGGDLWPDSIAPLLHDVEIAIARTEPPGPDSPTVPEIENLYLDSIRAARDYIYLESQYFCADSITAAIRERLADPDGPEVVVINPMAAQSVVEDAAMHVSRSRMIRMAASASSIPSTRRASRSMSMPRSASSTIACCGSAPRTSTAARWPSTPNATWRWRAATRRAAASSESCATGCWPSIWTATRPPCRAPCATRAG